MFVSAEQTSNFVVGVTSVSPWTTPPPNNTQGPNVCAYYPGTAGLNTNTTINCATTTSPGRYLYIKKMDTNELSLCEVQVHGTGTFAHWCVYLNYVRVAVSAAQVRTAQVLATHCGVCGCSGYT